MDVEHSLEHVNPELKPHILVSFSLRFVIFSQTSLEYLSNLFFFFECFQREIDSMKSKEQQVQKLKEKLVASLPLEADDGHESLRDQVGRKFIKIIKIYSFQIM